VHSLVVSDTALFPLGSPAVRALSGADIERLRGQLVVELDGATVIQEPCNAFDTRASDILLGEAPFGSDTDRKFDGEIRRSERLAVPVSGETAAGDKARLRVRFPNDRIGRSEPIVSLSSGTNSRVCYVTYLAKGEVGITCCGRWGVPQESAKVLFDPEKEHDFEFHAGEISGRPGSFDVACAFDGVHLFGHTRPPPVAERTVLTAGLNLAGAPGVDSRFTGPEIELHLAADPAPIEPEETVGPEHLVISLPHHATGRSEPLLSTGVTGAADIIYLQYIDGSHVRIGFDHWAYGGGVSGPIKVDYSVPHDVWISTGALFPASTDDPAWGKLSPDARKQLKSGVLVTIDGREALSCPGKTYPSAPGNVVVARNPAGASTCEAEFTGQLVFAERAGATAPPAAR
jgi:hypothetical protein